PPSRPPLQLVPPLSDTTRSPSARQPMEPSTTTLFDVPLDFADAATALAQSDAMMADRGAVRTSIWTPHGDGVWVADFDFSESEQPLGTIAMLEVPDDPATAAGKAAQIDACLAGLSERRKYGWTENERGDWVAEVCPEDAP